MPLHVVGVGVEYAARGIERRSVKFGRIHLMQLPKPWTEESNRTLLNDALDLAEQCGLDYVWGTEHHFLEEYSHSAAPEMFLAACASAPRTSA